MRIVCGKLALGLAVTLAGCAVDGEMDEVGTESSALTGGDLVPSNVAPYDGIVRIRMPGGGGCTASKIGARRLITAAHCVENVDDGVLLADGDSLDVSNRLDGTYPAGSAYTVDSVVMHPSWSNHLDGSNDYRKVRGYDVAIIDLTTNLPAAWTTLTIRGTYVDTGAVGTTVGYGCDISLTPDTHKSKKQEAEFTAVSLADFQAGSPRGSTTDYGIHTAYVIHALATNDTETCPGDSGGPQFFGNGQIGAITARHLDGYSRQTRTGNVQRWIANPSQDSFSANQWGVFLNGKSNLCIGVGGASTAQGAEIAQYFCDARKQLEDNQYWQLKHVTGAYYQIVNGKSNRCIGVDGGSTANGVQLHQYTCDDIDESNKNQAWKFELRNDGKYQIRNGKSGRCIGVAGASVDIDAKLFQFTCDDAANQGWNFVR